jgi:hypothetical protein
MHKKISGVNNNAEGAAGWGLSYLWRGRSKSEKQSGTNQVKYCANNASSKFKL